MKVLVLVARGLQAGAVGCYGNSWIDTPALDALAAEGVVFDRHFADAADPAGARRAWRSGRYGIPSLTEEGPHPEDSPDLLAALRSHGVYTCLIVDDSRPSPPEFTSGWDEAERVAPEGVETPLEATLEAARAILDRLADRAHWLLWIELATLLPPWNVPEEFQAPYFMEEPAEDEEDEGEEPEEEPEPLTPLTDVETGSIDPTDDTFYLRLQTSYAAAVTYLDAGIGQLLDDLRERDHDALVLVTTDCGQALGEHGYVGPHCPWPHNEIVHLPLIVHLPGAAESGRRIAALTQAVDLAATLAHVFGAPLPSAHGHSLLSLMHGDVERVRDYACSGLRMGAAVEWALRTADWAFLLPVRGEEDESARPPQFYVKPDDRWEVNNVLQHHLELVEHLEQTLRAFVAATRQPGPLHPPELRNVEAETASSPNPIPGGTTS
jgi:arylsulfatase A-like enzyme